MAASNPSQHAAQCRHPATLFTRPLLSAVLATIIGAVPHGFPPIVRTLAAALLLVLNLAASAFAQGTLLRGGLHSEPRSGVDGPSFGWFPGQKFTITDEDTGEVREVEINWAGRFEVRGLQPGRYRVDVDAVRVTVVWSGEILALRPYRAHVLLQEFRPLTLWIVQQWVKGDDPLADVAVIGRPLAAPVIETCRADRSAPLAESADSWGELWGVLRTPDGGNAPAGLRVNIEALPSFDPFLADPFITQTRTTETGCYGVHGLMPGRYRVFVDEPPFVFAAEVQVPARESGGATRRDGELTTPPERAAGQPLRVGWYSRLRFLYSYYPDLLVEAVERAELAANINDPDDLAHVNGAVIWQNEPNDWRQHYRVPGVTVIFEHEGTKQQYTATTDSDGSFDFYVPQGRYRMLVAHQPFTTARARILALPEGFVIREGFKTARGSGVYAPRAARRSGLMTGINIGLVMPIDERTGIQTKTLDTDSFVSVAANAPPDIAGPLAPTFTTRDIERPLIGGRARTPQSMFPLTPGVLMTESLGTLAQYTSMGQRRFSNRLTIDGISADLGVDVRGPGIGTAGSEALPAQATSGGTETLVPANAIDEFRIRTTNATPQYAQTPGAQTSIVTRAGADTAAGQLFLDERLRAFGARDPFNHDSPPPQSRNYGASLGGPFVPGRVRYFATWESQQIDRPVAAVAEVPSLTLRETAAPGLLPLFAAFPRPNGRELADGRAELRREFPVTSALDVLSARVDGSFSHHHAFGRVGVGRSRGTALSSAAARQLPDFTFDRQESTSTRTGTLGLLSTLSASGRFVNDLRVGLTAHQGGVVAGAAPFGNAEPLALSELIGAAVPERNAFVSIALLPGPDGTIRSGRVSDTTQSQFQVSNTLTYAAGRHEWRAGVDLTRVAAGTAGANRYTYSFAPGASQLRQVAIEDIEPARALFQTFAFFLQDTFRLSNRLTLNLGARYSIKPAPVSRTDLTPTLVQFEHLPTSMLLQPPYQPLWRTRLRDGFAPQAGAAYQLGRAPRRSTTLRGGWSLTYDELTSPGAIAFGRGAPYFASRTIRPSTFPVPAGELDATTGPTRTEYFAFPTSLKRPRTYGWFASIDQELGSTQRVTLSYVGTAGRKLIYWYAYNPFSAAQINVYTNDGSSDYDALIAQYIRRVAGGFEAQAVYTWSRARDNDSGELLTSHLPPGLSAPAAERGPADFDRPHVLTLTGGYRVPTPPVPGALRAIASDWQIDAAAVFRSGAPFSVTVPRDFGGGSVYTARTDSADAPDWLVEGRVLNAAAFPIATERRQGTRGRNDLRAAPLRQVDLALSRTVRLGRRTVATVRAEAFNVFGIANYGPPESRRLASDFGLLYQTAAHALGTGTLSSGGLVPLQQIGGPRSIQLGVRFGW